MSSESQFRKCPGCGQQIHIVAKYCPHCGNKGPKKKLRWYHWAGLGFLALVLLAALTDRQDKETASPSSSKAPVTSSASKSAISQSNLAKPEAQKKFENTVQVFFAQFRDAKNELQQSALRKQRREVLAGLGLGMTVNGWVGTIKNMTTTTKGQAAVSIALGNGIAVHTWDNQLSDIGANTLIDSSNPLFNVLAGMSK